MNNYQSWLEQLALNGETIAARGAAQRALSERQPEGEIISDVELISCLAMAATGVDGYVKAAEAQLRKLSPSLIGEVRAAILRAGAEKVTKGAMTKGIGVVQIEVLNRMLVALPEDR